MRQTSLVPMSSIPPAVAGLVVLAYNGIVRRTFAEYLGNRAPMPPIALIYFTVAIAIGLFVGLHLEGRLKAAADPIAGLRAFLWRRAAVTGQH